MGINLHVILAGENRLDVFTNVSTDNHNPADQDLIAAIGTRNSKF